MCRVLPNRKMENRFTAVGGYSESQLGASMVMESPDFALDAVHGPCERIDVPGARSWGLASDDLPLPSRGPFRAEWAAAVTARSRLMG